VCDPRKNARWQDGNKSDRIDARKLAELLRTSQLTAVYPGEHGMRTLKELGRSSMTIPKDAVFVASLIRLDARTRLSEEAARLFGVVAAGERCIELCGGRVVLIAAFPPGKNCARPAKVSTQTTVTMARGILSDHSTAVPVNPSSE